MCEGVGPCVRGVALSVRGVGPCVRGVAPYLKGWPSYSQLATCVHCISGICNTDYSTGVHVNTCCTTG